MSAGEPHILIVDDNREIRDGLSRYLRANGYRATAADSAAAARSVLKTNGIDLAVIDVMMPGEDGLKLTSGLRGESALPIIMLTARGEEVDRIIGLEIGADDYVAKPFNPRELIARIGAVLRRARIQGGKPGELQSQRVRFENWVLDIARRELIGVNGTALPLSAGEFRLLIAFIERPKVALTRDQLLDITQGRNLDTFDRSVDSAVSRLRRKIESDARNPRLIKTVWGGGYVFTAEPVAA
jgi:two-component system OmpR family response regulator